MAIYFGRPTDLSTIAEAVPLYGWTEFESPTRSTIPMLDLLIHARDTFNEIVHPMGFPDNCDLFLEYTVPPQQGQGTASHTDVMLKWGANALAIEAKWNESMYETVGKWLNRGNHANREHVLRGWLDLLQNHTPHQHPLHNADFGDAIYQMVHRAASAATAQNPSMAYFLFEPSRPGAATPEQLSGKLGDLWNILGGPAAFQFYLVQIKIRPWPPYEGLLHLPTPEETSEAVIEALQSEEPLFAFGDPQVQLIGAAP